MVGKLSAKARHFDRLALAESAHVDAGRGANDSAKRAAAALDAFIAETMAAETASELVH